MLEARSVAAIADHSVDERGAVDDRERVTRAVMLREELARLG